MSRTIEQPIQKAESELKPKNRWKIGLAVASAIAYAIEQPKEVDINEILLRPTAQQL